MRRELTTLEGVLVMALLVAGVALTLLTAGCAAVPSPVTYQVIAPFTVVVGDQAYIQKQAYALGLKGVTLGFYHLQSRTLYVMQDIHHRERPDLEILGHEIWHLPELGGMWHE